MHQILSDFLAQFGYCPLPGIGTLRSKKDSAYFEVGTNTMFPPMEHFELQGGNVDAAPLLDYAEAKMAGDHERNRSVPEFLSLLRDALNRGKRINIYKAVLQKDEEEIKVLPMAAYSFYGPVPAERVLRQNKVHEMLVGEKSTNSSEMTDYYAALGKEKKNKWLLPVVLVLILLVVLIYFIINSNLFRTELVFPHAFRPFFSFYELLQ